MKQTILVLTALVSVSASQSLCANKKIVNQNLFQFHPAPDLTVSKAVKLINYCTITGIGIEGMYHAVVTGSYLNGLTSATCYLFGTAGFIDNFFDAFYVKPQKTMVKKKPSRKFFIKKTLQ